jgi:hypothetical protein
MSDRRQIVLRRFRFPSQYTGRVICTICPVPMCLIAERFPNNTLLSIAMGNINYHFQTHNSKDGLMYLENQINEDFGRLVLSPFLLKRDIKRWKVILS